MALYISPKHTLEQFPNGLTLEDKIDVFHARTTGWQLHIAEQMANGVVAPDGTKGNGIAGFGYAALHVVFSYFETIAKYEEGYKGRDKSSEYFRKGVRSVLPPLARHDSKRVEDALSVLYQEVRCGLYHASMTGGSVVISADFNFEIQVGFGANALVRVEINPHRLPARLQSHLDDYVRRLRDPANTDPRDRFLRRFDSDWNFRWQPTAGKE